VVTPRAATTWRAAASHLGLPPQSSYKVGGGLSVKVQTTPHPLAATDPTFADAGHPQGRA